MKTPIELNRHTLPPGGWQFVQPQTGWRAPTPVSSTFDQTVILIISHRRANLVMANKNHLPLSVLEVGNELERYTRHRLNIPEPALPKSQPLRNSSRSVGGVADEINRAVVGIGVIRDWLGDGLMPVAQELAEARAARCAECPENSKANFVQRLEGLAAEAFKLAMEARQQLSCQTSLDEKLLACQVCNCYLKLKVWTPEQFIYQRTPLDQLEALRIVRTASGRGCWIVEPPP